MAKKSTTKAKTKTVQAAKSGKVTVTSRQTLALPKLNLFSAAVLAIVAVLTAVMMSSATYVLTITYLTLDKLQGGAIVPAYRHYFDLELRWVVVALLAFVAAWQVMRVTRFKAVYNKALQNQRMPWRWVGLGIVGVIMTETVALLAGYQDLATLKLFGALAVVTVVFGCLAERDVKNDKVMALRSHLVGLISAAVTVVLIGLSLLYTPVFGEVRASWYVYAAFAVLVGYNALLSINQYNQIRAYKNWKSYEVVERNYVVITLVSLVTLAAVLVAGLPK